MDPSGNWFSCSQSFACCFNTVICGIAQDMRQWIAHRLGHFAVDFDFITLNDQLNRFIQLDGDVAQCAG